MGKHSAQGNGFVRKRQVRKANKMQDARLYASSGLVEAAPALRIQQQRKRQLIKRIVLGVFAALVVVALGLGAWVYLTLHGAINSMNKSAKVDKKLAKVLTKPKAAEPFTILLMGNDRRPGDTRYRADTIIVAKVDPQLKKVWMLSIPRDTRVDIPGHGVSKINAANAYGGSSLMVETVHKLLGVPINHYMEINFDGFEKIVQILGGVWINVDTNIDDWKAASNSPHHRASHISKGYQLLDAEHALVYVRSRAFPDADFTRMRHQQEFFKALAKQAAQFGNVLKIPTMVAEISKYMSTDMSMGDLVSTVTAMRSMGSDNVQTATVTGVWRSPFVYTDETRKAALVDAFINERPFDSTATVSAATKVDPKTVSVTVRNGAGISGCANVAAGMLKTAGYNVGEVGNASQFVYTETLVIYKDSKTKATQVAGELPSGKVVASNGMYSFTTDVLVVVGKDYSGWSTKAAQ